MEPSVVVVYQGTNDPAFTAQQYRDYLALIRSAYPAARIAAIAPYQRPAHVLPIRAAVEALTDPLICFLDYSSAFDAADTGDGSHFNLGGASRMSHRLAGDIRERMI
jgi:lysophospholipase L1-like esterase